MDETLQSPRVRLSERQRQCLELVGEGHTSKEIGRRLGLSPSTVDNHIRSALERLNVSNRATAVRAMRAMRATGSADGTARAASAIDLRSFSPFALPPLGGAVNNLSSRRRVWHIVQIALFGIMGMTASVITIAGLVNLFSR